VKQDLSTKGRRRNLASYAESSAADESDFEGSLVPIHKPTKRPARSNKSGMLGELVQADDTDVYEDESEQSKRKQKKIAGTSRAVQRKGLKTTRKRMTDESDAYEVGQDTEEDLDDEIAATSQSGSRSSEHGPRARPKKSKGRKVKAVYSSDDEMPAGRQLRERPKVNYALPALLPEENSARKRPRDGGGNLTGPTQHYGGFLMDMTRGVGALADPNMPNMPDSDSVRLDLLY
jgi:hypothetical protein